MAACDRCGEEKERLYPLDAVAHPMEDNVCESCVEPWDEVVDL